LSGDNIQMARLIYHRSGDWSLHIVYKIALPELKGPGEVMALDLGMKNLVSSACTDGSTSLWTGGELAALERYFEKQKSKTTRSLSRNSRDLNQKRSRQRIHVLHCFTKSLVRDAEARGVSTIVVGDLKGIRDDKDRGDSGNQHIHKWPFDTIINLLTYKARLRGIEVVTEKETYTSQTCCRCNTRDKSSRVHRGLYVCKHCGAVMNADVNGAINLLTRYLPGEIHAPWSSGCLAQPASTGLPGEKPGPQYQPINRGRGKHLCRFREQNQSWLSAA